MTYLIFIRHAQKKYRNNKGPPNLPRHDPPIINSMEKVIIDKVRKYFDTYGKPDKIICSPFLRTRQTANVINSILDKKIPIIIEKKTEEFLGFQKPKASNADLDSETLKYTQPKLGLENIYQLEKRAVNFFQEIKDDPENIIIVTHGFFITRLAKYLNLHISYIDELEGIIIKNDIIEKLIK